MAQINRILIPVDFSDVSQKALRYGIPIATAFKADLLVVSVVEDRAGAVVGSKASAQEKADLFAQVQTKLEALIPEEDRGGLDCNCTVKTGDIEARLLEAVAENHVDLVIMGTHGRRAFKRWLLGCVTERILRRVLVPLVTLSHLEGDIESDPLSKRSVLYATDLSYGSKRGLDLGYLFAKAFNVGFTVLHVIPPWAGILSGESEPDHARLREHALSRLEASIPEPVRTDARVRCELGEGRPYETILKVADEKDVGLIVVNRHGEHRAEPPSLGSTAERVIRGSHRPVLSLPAVSH